MSNSSSTFNLIQAVKNLEPLSSKKMHASGFELTLSHLGKPGEPGQVLAEIQLAGELTDDIKDIIIESVRVTLENRKIARQAELNDITNFLQSIYTEE